MADLIFESSDLHIISSNPQKQFEPTETVTCLLADSYLWQEVQKTYYNQLVLAQFSWQHTATYILYILEHYILNNEQNNILLHKQGTLNWYFNTLYYVFQ